MKREPSQTNLAASPTQHRRFGRAEWMLLAALLGVAAVAILVMVVPGFVEGLDQFFNRWKNLAVDHGYLGVFLAMFIGNLTIIIILPTTIVPFLVAAAGLNPIVIGIVSGLGAELGEMLGYVLGRWFASTLERKKPQTYSIVRRIVEVRPRAIPLLLYIFSVFPFPDDVLFIPLGLVRYPLWKLVWPSLLGKVTAGLIIAWTGSTASVIVGAQAVSRAAVFRELAFVGFLVLVVYVFVKIPWATVLRRFSRT